MPYVLEESRLRERLRKCTGEAHGTKRIRYVWRKSSMRDLGQDIRLFVAEHRIVNLQAMVRRTPTLVSIQTLTPRPYRLDRPIFAVVQPDDGCFIATFLDANISGSGETEIEAVEMLKDMIASTYRLFLEKEAFLGDEPQRQLAVLREFMRAK